MCLWSAQANLKKLTKRKENNYKVGSDSQSDMRFREVSVMGVPMSGPVALLVVDCLNSVS